MFVVMHSSFGMAAGRLQARGQRRAQVPQLVFHLCGIGKCLRHFRLQEGADAVDAAGLGQFEDAVGEGLRRQV